MNHRKYLTAVILGLTASLLTSCNNGSNTGDTPAVVPEPILVTPPPVAEPEPTKEEQLAKLEAELATVDTEIKAMIGQAQCASSLDCRLLYNDSVFDYNCNGVRFYAAYSIVETNQEILAAAHIKKGKIRDKIFRIKNGLSDSYDPPTLCPLIIEPWHTVAVVACNNNRCQGGYEYPWFNDMPVPVPTTSSILSEITAMIGDPVCSSSEQCGVWSVDYSSADCGDTKTFAYSTFATEPKQIAEKVGQYAQSVAANYNAQGYSPVCQSNVSFMNGVCRNEKCEAN